MISLLELRLNAGLQFDFEMSHHMVKMVDIKNIPADAKGLSFSPATKNQLFYIIFTLPREPKYPCFCYLVIII